MVNSMEEKTETQVKHIRGPHGLGDPDDRSLRKVEVEVLIPKKMREKARREKCDQEVQDFNACALDNGAGLVFKCRKENARLKDCLTFWYQDEAFKKTCTDEYLNERSEFRRTGIPREKQMKRMGS